jgi:photosystem II stability/assembly factor-like uncharacterized protein
MKFQIFITTLLILGVCTACKTAQPAGWRQIINKSPLEKVVTYYCAAFEDNDLGLVTGFAGQIFYTTDDAATWRQSANSSFCLFTLEINGSYVWACGDKGNVRVSKNRGRSFEPLTDFGPPEPDHCRYLSFISPDTGWIASPTLLAGTTDGGRTWTVLSLPPGSKKLAAIDLITDTQGLILDSAGVLYRTENGGTTWRPRPLGPGMRMIDLEIRNSPSIALRFANPEQGMLAARTKNPFSIGVFVTSNGGASWDRRTLTTDRDYAQGSIYLSRDLETITVLDTQNQTVSVFTNPLP